MAPQSDIVALMVGAVSAMVDKLDDHSADNSVTERFVEDLLVAYAWDEPEHYHLITWGDVSGLGGLDRIREAALATLRARADTGLTVLHEGTRWGFALSGGSRYLTASLLLVPDVFLNRFDSEGPIAVGIGERTMMFGTDAADPDEVDTLFMQNTAIFDKAEQGFVTPSIYEVDHDGRITRVRGHVPTNDDEAEGPFDVVPLMLSRSEDTDTMLSGHLVQNPVARRWGNDLVVMYARERPSSYDMVTWHELEEFGGADQLHEAALETLRARAQDNLWVGRNGHSTKILINGPSRDLSAALILLPDLLSEVLRETPAPVLGIGDARWIHACDGTDPEAVEKLAELTAQLHDAEDAHAASGSLFEFHRDGPPTVVGAEPSASDPAPDSNAPGASGSGTRNDIVPLLVHYWPQQAEDEDVVVRHLAADIAVLYCQEDQDAYRPLTRAEADALGGADRVHDLAVATLRSRADNELAIWSQDANISLALNGSSRMLTASLLLVPDVFLGLISRLAQPVLGIGTCRWLNFTDGAVEGAVDELQDVNTEMNGMDKEIAVSTDLFSVHSDGSLEQLS